jgi:hypothetical protein
MKEKPGHYQCSPNSGLHLLTRAAYIYAKRAKHELRQLIKLEQMDSCWRSFAKTAGLR